MKRRQWASAIVTAQGVTMSPHRPEPLAHANWQQFAASHPGQFAAAEVTVGQHTFTAVSLYGLWEEMPDFSDRYAEATLHRAISDLTPLLQARSACQTKIGVVYDEHLVFLLLLKHYQRTRSSPGRMPVTDQV